MIARVLLISDTHFCDGTDPLLARVISTARELKLQGPADAVVLAGDLFDLYVGNKECFRREFTDWHSLVQEWVDAGVRVGVIEGNHDFQLEGVFPAAVTLHSASCTLELAGGQRLWVEHGDLVDGADVGYRVLRTALRSPLIRILIRHAPDHWLQWVGERLRSASSKRHPRQPDPQHRDRLRSVYHAAAEKKFSEGFAHVVMGHCHDLDEHASAAGQYFNMGYPRVHEKLIVFQNGNLNRLAILSAARSLE